MEFLGLCRCGQRNESTGIGSPTITYDGNGNIIYEVCCHGITIIDIREDEWNFNGFQIDEKELQSYIEQYGKDYNKQQNLF